MDLSFNLETRALLVGVLLKADPPEDQDEDLEELAQLAQTAGLKVVGRLSQKRSSPHPASYLGKGKIRELEEMVVREAADLVVSDDALSPRQVRQLEKILDCPVIDRSMLILDIFARRAKSAEGKIQVELAQLKKSLTRLHGKGLELSRLGAGIGTRGPGESKLESDQRRIRKRIQSLEGQLDQVMKARKIRAKKSKDLFRVALIGYTNAGKSSWLNRLAADDQYVKDQLFASLDPVTRRVLWPDKACFLLSDTVGFIHKLPHDLVAAFRASLEEVRRADLLLFVMDACSQNLSKERRAVLDVLTALEAEDKARILIMNKADKLSYEKAEALKLAHPRALLVSAKSGENEGRLMDMIRQHYESGRVFGRFFLPFDKGYLLDALFGQVDNKTVSYEQEGYVVEGSFDPATIKRLRKEGLDGESRAKNKT